MGGSELVLGLIRPSGSGGLLEQKGRDLSIAWSRYGYRDSIVEGESIAAILDAASDGDHRHCLILAPGVLIRESWRGEGESDRDFYRALADWIEGHDFFVAGRFVEGRDAWYGLDTRCLLVDLGRYRDLGRPAVGDAPAPSQDLPLPVQGLDPTLLDQLLDVGAADQPGSERLARYLGEGIEHYVEERESASLSADQRELLEVAANHSANARRGVFLWNIEPYDDVESPPPDFTGPASRIYSVAAGFKPNRILETHGFDPQTSVTFFDYSQRALDVRRFTIDSWDGSDFPGFVRKIFDRFPYPETYYHLWRDRTPEQVSDADLSTAWSREVTRWGGEHAFSEHWSRYRELPHEFVPCDVVGNPDALLDRIAPDPRAVMWWSNAFFTVHSNWHYTWSKRRERYEAWVSGLASRNPALLVYGSDHDNSNVNWIRVGDYWTRYREMPGDDLVPRKLRQHEIRM